MPTGYTAAIADGIAFETFVMNCARAMGACIMLRDDPGGGEHIPERFEPSDYNARRLAEAREELSRVRAMTTDQVIAECDRTHAIAVGEHRRRKMERDDLRKKYEAMLDRVRAWKPPTSDHDGLKSFMVQQITESINFDCWDHDSEPKPVAPKAWKEQLEAKLVKDCSYHAGEHAKEVERAKARTDWIVALRASLGTEVTP